MFPYDSRIAAAATSAHAISDVLAIMQKIDSLCIEADGLKWFNTLYLQVTEAIKAQVDAGEFSGPGWLNELDAQSGWRSFQKTDFERLKSQMGVDWVVLANPPVAGLICPYQNARVSVCRVE